LPQQSQPPKSLALKDQTREQLIERKSQLLSEIASLKNVVNAPSLAQAPTPIVANLTGQLNSNAYSHAQVAAPTPIVANLTGQLNSNAYSHAQASAPTPIVANLTGQLNSNAYSHA
jgi:hypothetical protein